MKLLSRLLAAAGALALVSPAAALPQSTPPAPSTDLSNATGTLSTLRLPASGVVAGTYGDAAHTVSPVVDQYGRVTGLTQQLIAIGAGQVSGLATLATSGKLSDGVGQLGLAQLPFGVPDVPVVPGLSTSTTPTLGTNYSKGSGFVAIPNGTDFQPGQGVRINGAGPTFASYTAPSLAAPTVGGLVGTTGTTTVYYALVPTDGMQGYGAPSGIVSLSDAPSPRSIQNQVVIAWTEGVAPPPAYVLCSGPSPTTMTVADFVQAGAASEGAMITDYGHAAPKQQDWLPASDACPLNGPVNSALHTTIYNVGSPAGFLQVSVGINVAAGAALTLIHDNSLPLRYALYGGASYKVPEGAFHSSVTSYGGANIVLSGNCLYGSGRSATRLIFDTAMIAVGGISMSGAKPCIEHMTLDNGSDWASQQAIVALNGTIGARLYDFSVPDIAKYGITDSGGIDTVLDSFDLTSLNPDPKVGTGIVAANATNFTAQNFRMKGTVPDILAVGSHFRNFVITGWRSGSGIVTEQQPTSSDTEIANGEVASYAPTTQVDSNGDQATGLEIWSTRTRVSNVYVHDNPGGGISMGGPNSILSNITLRNNAGVDINCRMDSPTYNCKGLILGSIMEINDITTPYLTTYGYFTQGGGTSGANGGTYAKFGAGNTFVGSTAPIDHATLTNTETFAATTATPPQ